MGQPSMNTAGVVACLVEREAPLSTLLAALPEWEQSYADDLSALFVYKKKPALPEQVSAAAHSVPLFTLSGL